MLCRKESLEPTGSNLSSRVDIPDSLLIHPMSPVNKRASASHPLSGMPASTHALFVSLWFPHLSPHPNSVLLSFELSWMFSCSKYLPYSWHISFVPFENLFYIRINILLYAIFYLFMLGQFTTIVQSNWEITHTSYF